MKWTEVDMGLRNDGGILSSQIEHKLLPYFEQCVVSWYKFMTD